MPLAVVCERPGLGNLQLAEREPEPLRPGTVRVAIAAVGLNYRDLLVIRGRYGPSVELPLVPGSDAAGRVVEVGDGVPEVEVGQRVCTHMVPDWRDGPLRPEMRATTLGGPAEGVLCQERVLPAGAVVAIPESLAFEEAACLPVAGLTAWSALREAHAASGETRVLALGTGGLSIMGLQLAKLRGFRVGITSSSDRKLERARELGADFTVNHAQRPWPELVRRWSEGGVDLVLEVVGEQTFDSSVRCTRDGGCVAAIGALGEALGSPGAGVTLSELLMRRIRVQGIFVGSRAELQSLVEFAGDYAFRPVIDRVYDSLADARRALAYLQSGEHLGKVVVRVGGAGG